MTDGTVNIFSRALGNQKKETKSLLSFLFVNRLYFLERSRELINKFLENIQFRPADKPSKHSRNETQILLPKKIKNIQPMPTREKAR